MLRLPLICLALVCLARSSGPTDALPQDAYVWQRNWTPSVGDAIRQSADLVRAWRVLALEMREGHAVAPASVDWMELARSGRPAILVVRIDGRLATYDERRLLGDIGELVRNALARGMPVAGVEIDHDCATAKLRDYARFLGRLRGAVPGGVPISITALPAWLNAPPLFREVSKRADEIVLQVHAVQNPHLGLFDAATALEWTAAMARLTGKPFRVALPSYGSRVFWRDDGRILAVESESPVLGGTGPSSELVASPVAVSAVLRALERNPPPRFAGIVWFRLPTAADVRAWSPSTWRAVMRGDALTSQVSAEIRDSGTPGMQTIVLVNAGDVDSQLPAAVELDARCDGPADGVNGYALRHDTAQVTLTKTQDGLLRSGQQRVIGWVRCPSSMQVHLHVRS